MAEQTSELSAGLQRIVADEARRTQQDTEPALYTIEFFAAGARLETSLASFRAYGPLPVPVVGQQVMVHGVDVTVTNVYVCYDVTEEDRVAFYAHVDVVEAE
ncbi:hypothetical protein ACLQ2N_32620 [Streptomyces sp. DT224]|uniref:hypothetical protein n=1 Tax=Streptomyces sp. DT224 TaxID=3393426 RepID=UPI003CF74DC7